MARDLCWRWELTPKELFAGFFPAQDSGSAKLPVASKEFDGAPKRALEGTPYTYQIVTKSGKDGRSGVIAFDEDGTTIVGSLLLRGLFAKSYTLAVVPELRNQDIAFKILVEWCDQSQRPRVLSPQPITLASAKALLAAHRVVVNRALERMDPMPDHVIDAVSKGVEANAILRAWT